MDTPPHSNSRNMGALNSSNDGISSNNFGVNGSQSEGMHVFVNSSTNGGHLSSGGKFVAASQQYLQVRIKTSTFSLSRRIIVSTIISLLTLFV